MTRRWPQIDARSTPPINITQLDVPIDQEGSPVHGLRNPTVVSEIGLEIEVIMRDSLQVAACFKRR